VVDQRKIVRTCVGTASIVYVREVGCVDARVQYNCGSHTNQGVFTTYSDLAEAKFDVR
jgi:hypothetical protein